MRKGVILSVIAVLSIAFVGCGENSSNSTTTKQTKTMHHSLATQASDKRTFEPRDHNATAKNNGKKIISIKKQVTHYSPEQISIKSHPDYTQNDHGIITASTLNRWLNDWQHTKPKGVEGRLIVLQAGKTRFDDNRTFLPHNDKDVFVYGIPGAGSCDPSYTRFDGISNTPGAMITGALIDRNINAFQINPAKDYVVIAMSQGSVGIRELARTMWSMIYWGWDLNRIAFLNGSVEYNYFNKKEMLVATPSPFPKPEHQYHMSSLGVDRTSLHIYLDEMKQIAAGDKKGIFLVDARGTAEYTGAKKSATKTKTCGADHKQQCYSAFRGHIRGAINFPYTDLLVMDDEKCDINHDGKIDKMDASYKFKSYDELKKIYACKGYKPGDRVIAYCRTGRKATLITLTSTLVLGYPVRMYDGSWMQWGSLASTKDTNCNLILDPDAKARTDLPKYSCILGYNNPLDVEPRETYDIHPDATHAQQIKIEDQAYLKQ